MSTSPEPSASAPTRAPEHGVIHDIGYRHYDGPRLGTGYIQRSLFVEGARGAYGLGRSARSKIMPMLLLAAMCFPAVVIAIVAAVTNAESLPGGYTTYVVNLQFVVAVFVAAQAPALVSRDLRFSVMPLYFSRPIRRVHYVRAKYAAMSTALFVLMAVPLAILFVGALLAELPIGEQIPDYLRSLAGAVLYSLVLAGIGLVIAAVTPRRGLGVAAIISVLLVLMGVQGAVQNIAAVEGSTTVAGYSGLLSPFTLVDGVVDRLLGADSAMGIGPPNTLGGLVFLLVTLLLIAGCYGALVLRYRKVSAS